MSILATVDWQTRAIAAYQWTRGQSLQRFHDEIVERIQRLTGRTVARETIWIDRETHIATLRLDGVLFRFHRQHLVVVRSCVGCGVQHLASTPIDDEVDLGYALGVWEPRCQHCPVEDAEI